MVFDVRRVVAEQAADDAGAVVQIERNLQFVVDDFLAGFADD